MAMNNRDRYGDTYANNTTKKMIALYDYDPQVSFLEYRISFEHNFIFSSQINYRIKDFRVLCIIL